MLEMVDLSKTLSEPDYAEALPRLQVELRQLAYQVYVEDRPVVMVFEGWDAAGKGGAIRRVTARIDPRGYVVHQIAKPEGEDAERHYLFRFWRRLPERGQIAIFDRSWYGRVMVERIEGFCTTPEWRRAYREIKQFERGLVDFGAILVKFWIHLSKDEQLNRFEARESDRLKKWKLTEEDWRNREKWDEYERAVDEMLLKTSAVRAPWTVIEGNCKRWARVRALEVLTAKLRKELEPSGKKQKK